MLTRSSAAMKAANNTLEETIALETAAVQITRNAETTGTAFRTVSMRLRGYDEETEELSDDLKTISGDIYDLTKVNGGEGITIFSDKEKTTYKSTYEILKEISSVWSDLTDKQQASLLEKLGGKRGGQVLAGLLSDFSEVERAMDEMENAAGSADAEMSVIRDSIEYKLNAFKQTWIGFAQELLSRDDIKEIIDSATEASEGFGKTVKAITPALSSFIGLISDLIFALGKFADITGGAFPVIVAGFAGIIKYHNSIKEFITDIQGLSAVIEKVNKVPLSFTDGELDDNSKEMLSTFLAGTNEERAKSVLTSLGVSESIQEEILERAGLTSALTAQEIALQSLTASQIKNKIQSELGTQAETEALILKMQDLDLLTEQGVATQFLTKARIEDWVAEKQLTEAEAEQIITSLGLTGANTTQGISVQGLTTALIANTKARIANTLATMAAHPVLTALGVATAALAAGFLIAANNEKKEAERLEEVKNKATEAKKAISSLHGELKSQIKAVNDISDSYANLAQNISDFGQVSQSQGALSNDDYEQFLDYSNQLAEIFPQLIKGYDDNGNAILDLAGDVDTIVGSLDNLIQKEKELTNYQISENLRDVWEGYSIEQSERDENLERLENRYKAFKELSDEYFKTGKINNETLQKMWFFTDEDDQKVFESFGIQNWWNFDKSTDLLMDVVSKRANDAYNDIQRLKNEINSSQSELGSYINSWLSTDIDYVELSEDMQNVVKDLFSDSSWFSILKKNNVDTSNWDEVQYFFDANLMDQLEKLDTDKYKQKFIEILNGTASSFDIKSFLQEYINEIKTGTGFNPNDPIILYISTKLEEEEKLKSGFEDALFKSVGGKTSIETRYGKNGPYSVGVKALDETQQAVYDYLMGTIDKSEYDAFKAWAYDQGEKLYDMTGEEILKAFRDRNKSEDGPNLLSAWLQTEGNEDALSKYQSETKKISESLGKILTGTLTNEDKIALFEEYPELIDQADNLEGGLRDLANEGFEQLYKTMKENGASEEVLNMFSQMYSEAMKATDVLYGLIDANKKLSHMQGQTSDGLKMLGDIYSDVKDGETFDWSSILNNADFKTNFGNLKSYNDFIKTITANPTDIKATQAAFDQLATEYLKFSDIFKDITEENKQATINYLSDMGIGNAEELVSEYIKDFSDYENYIAKISNAFDKDTLGVRKSNSIVYQETTQSVLENTLGLDENTSALITNKVATLDLTEVSEEEQKAQQGVIDQTVDSIDSLLSQAGASDVVIASTRQLVAEQKIFSNQDLGIKDKVSELLKLAKAYGITLASATAFNKYEKFKAEGKSYLGDTDSVRKQTEALYNAFVNEFNQKIYEDAKIDASQIQVTGFNGGKGNDKDSGSGSDNYIDWIQRRIDVTNAAIDTLESKYENATSVKNKNNILLQEVEYAKTLLDTYRRAETYYDNYFNKKVKKYQKQNIGLTDELIQKVKDGTIQVQDFSKNENLYNALSDLQGWWDLVNESAKGYADTLKQISEKEQTAFDNINEKYDKRRERWNTNNSLLEARYNNLTGENLSAKNSNMDKQILKDYKQNDYYRQELSDVINRQKNNRAKLRDSLAKDTSTSNNVINKIKSLMKQGKIIPINIINKVNNDNTLATILAYNAGISEVKNAKANYKQSVQDTISEIVSENQSQIDDINAYYDLLQEDIDDRQKRQDAKAANAISIRDQNSFIRKSTANATDSVNLAKQRLDRIQSETKRDKNELNKYVKKSSLSDSDIAEIKQCTSSNTKISDDILNKVTNQTLYARMIAYNNDVDALEAAKLDYQIKEEELITTKRENAKKQFDTVTTGYEKVIGTLSNSLSDVDNEITRIESQGKKIDSTFYKAQMNLYTKENELISEELTRAQYRLSQALQNGDVQVGTAEYFEMLDAIQNIENEQTTMLANIKSAKDAITEIANSIQSDILDTVHNLTSEIELITTLLGDNLADEEIGGFTEAGLAALSNAQAIAMAYKSAQKEVKDLLDSMQKAYDNKNLTFIDSNGIERQYASLDKFKDAIDEVQDAYENETQSYYNSVKEITNLMNERYQAEIGYINNLIDKKKDLLSAEKDLYEYSKTISEQTNNINSLRKQIKALSGDTSLENQARVQKLQTQLKDAEEELQDTEYDHYIEAQQTMLDNFSAEYQQFVDQHLKDTDNLLREANSLVSENTSVISNAIEEGTRRYEYAISDETSSLLTEANIISEQLSEQNLSLIDGISGQTNTLSATMKEISVEITNAFDSLKSSTDVYYKDLNDSYRTVMDKIDNTGTVTPSSTSNNSDVKKDTKPENIATEKKSSSKNVRSDVLQLLKSGKALDKNATYGMFYTILRDNGFTNISNATMAELANMLSDSGRKYTANMFDSNSNGYKALRAALIKKLVAMGLLPKITSDQRSWFNQYALQGFSTGGIVKAIRDNGDSVLVSARPGEGIMTEQQTQAFLKLVSGQNLNSMNTIAQSLAGLDDKVLSSITNSNIGGTTIDNSGIEFNFVLENIANAADVMREIQNNTKYQKVLQDLTVNQLSGKTSRLSANKYKI